MDLTLHQQRNGSPASNEKPDGKLAAENLTSVARKCVMCLQVFDELGSIETASAEELKRIVDNVYKIAKIEITPSSGKIGPLCGSCRAKLGYDFDEDAYYEMLSQMYSESGSLNLTTIVTTTSGGIPVHIGLPPIERPDSPSSSPLLDAACGTFVITELGREDGADSASDLTCVICSKVFNFKSTLRLHIRSHHNTAVREPDAYRQPRKPRMYECNECNLSFKLKYDYDKHQAIHNRTNLFQCEMCYKMFKHKTYYIMHRNAKRCKAIPLNLSTSGMAKVSSTPALAANQELGASLSEGLRYAS